MIRYLKEHGVEEERISIIIKLARGNIGRALKMAQSESFYEMIDMIIKMLENVWKMDLFEIMSFIERLSKYKINIYDCFDFMRLWFRDVLLFKATSDMNLLIFKKGNPQEYLALTFNLQVLFWIVIYIPLLTPLHHLTPQNSAINTNVRREISLLELFIVLPRGLNIIFAELPCSGFRHPFFSCLIPFSSAFIL